MGTLSYSSRRIHRLRWRISTIRCAKNSESRGTTSRHRTNWEFTLTVLCTPLVTVRRMVVDPMELGKVAFVHR